MANEKVVTNEHGRFVFVRENLSKKFVCDRCLQPKVSKIQVEWTNKQGIIKQICNGCYGRLVSGVPL